MTLDPRSWSLQDGLLAAGAAFAVGVQARLLLQAGFGTYPPPGSEGLAWSTLLLLTGIALVAASALEVDEGLEAATGFAASAAESLRGAAGATARTPADAPDDRAEAGAGSPLGDAGPAATAEPPASLDVRLETPFDEAPAVAPGEDAPLRIGVDAPGLGEPVAVRLAVDEGDSRRVRTMELDAGAAVCTVSFSQRGPVEVAVTADHPRAEAAAARASGVCVPYREAVGRLLDDLRDALDRRGRSPGPGSTPRQVCRALPPTPGDELRDRLEALLYGDGPVRREDYLDVLELRDAALAALEEGSS